MYSRIPFCHGPVQDVFVIKPGVMLALFFLLRVYFCYSLVWMLQSAVCTQISVMIIILIVVIVTDVL
jgi:hypothetical protein